MRGALFLSALLCLGLCACATPLSDPEQDRAQPLRHEPDALARASERAPDAPTLDAPSKSSVRNWYSSRQFKRLDTTLDDSVTFPSDRRVAQRLKVRDDDDEDEEEEDEKDEEEEEEFEEEDDLMGDIEEAEEADPVLAKAELAGVIVAACLSLLLLAVFLWHHIRKRRLQQRYRQHKHQLSATEGGPATTTTGSSLVSLLRPLPSRSSLQTATTVEKVIPTPRVASMDHLSSHPEKAAADCLAIQETCTHTGQPIRRMSNLKTVCEFEPALRDELHLHPGDTVRVEQLYGDGWALGAIVHEGAPVSKYRVFPLQACSMPER